MALFFGESVSPDRVGRRSGQDRRTGDPGACGSGATGLKLKEAEAAIFEAPQDRAKEEAPDGHAVRSGAGPDVRGVKKGSRATSGDKAFARSDEEGLVDKLHTMPANRAENPAFDTMTEGPARRMPAGQTATPCAYAITTASCARPRVAALCDHPGSRKQFDRLIAKRRFRIEQCFGTMKRLFGLHRARYFGPAKTHARPAIARTRTDRSLQARPKGSRPDRMRKSCTQSGNQAIMPKSFTGILLMLPCGRL